MAGESDEEEAPGLLVKLRKLYKEGLCASVWTSATHEFMFESRVVGLELPLTVGQWQYRGKEALQHGMLLLEFKFTDLRAEVTKLRTEFLFVNALKACLFLLQKTIVELASNVLVSIISWRVGGYISY